MAGRIQIYTGQGKGKTTAALGLMLRFLGSGGRVCFIQFDKGSDSNADFYSERRTFTLFPQLEHHATGLVRFNAEKNTFRFNNIPGDYKEAQRGLELARQAMQKDHGLLVLDEVLSLVLTGLVTKGEIMGLIEDYETHGRKSELVLTGHEIWAELESKADLVTSMTKVKHYFDKSDQARKGIEY